MAPDQCEKAAEHENRRQPEWNVRVHGDGLLVFGLLALAVRKLSQDEHTDDRGDADADNDDEFCSHDLSYRRTGRSP